MNKKPKRRTLRERVVELETGLSSTDAEKRIMAGLVRVDGQVVDKAGALVKDDARVEVEAPRAHVGRGALKLEAALDNFRVSVRGRICADVGACTGGFTEVLLQAGAERVYAIDVGYGDLAWKLRADPRVVVMERTNARYIPRLDQPISFVTIDVSFISLKLILAAVTKWLDEPADVIMLVKPQFEALPEEVGEGGIVRDPSVHDRVIEQIISFLPEVNLHYRGMMRSPILGTEGNAEFLIWGARP